MSKSKFRPNLIGHLQSIIREQLSDKTIVVDELVEGTGIFGIVSASCLKYPNDDSELIFNVGLIPINITDKIIYWLSLNITYNPSTKDIISISISIYSDNNSVKLFRAEWTNNESKHNHAQPHWHIHTTKVDFTKSRWDQKDVNEIFEDAEIITNEEIEKLHFAMSASWHKKEDSVILFSKIEDSEILNWFEGVLGYIIFQLKYIHDKTKI